MLIFWHIKITMTFICVSICRLQLSEHVLTLNYIESIKGESKTDLYQNILKMLKITKLLLTKPAIKHYSCSYKIICLHKTLSMCTRISTSDCPPRSYPRQSALLQGPGSVPQCPTPHDLCQIVEQ